MRISDWSSDVCSSDLLAESYTAEQVRSKAFYPLAFPLICGPGTLAAALTVGATLHEKTTAAPLSKLAGSLPAIVLASLVVYLCLKFAAHFLHRLGPNGPAVLRRLAAFLLFYRGRQNVWD